MDGRLSTLNILEYLSEIFKWDQVVDLHSRFADIFTYLLQANMAHSQLITQKIVK